MPIHTTLSARAHDIINKIEKVKGIPAKNWIIERALEAYYQMISGSGRHNWITIKEFSLELVDLGLLKVPSGVIVGLSGPIKKRMAIVEEIINYLALSRKISILTVISNRDIPYIIAAKNFGDLYSKNLLFIEEISDLYQLYRIVQLSPSLIVIGDKVFAQLQCECGNIRALFCSSAWRIIADETKKKGTILILIATDDEAIEFCDVTVTVSDNVSDNKIKITNPFNTTNNQVKRVS